MGVEKAIEILVRAEADSMPVGPVSDLLSGELTLDKAHRVNEGNVQRRLDAGERLAGYKIGFTNIPVREQMGWPDSIYGHIMDSMVLKSGATVFMETLISPKIECEICFKLGQDLNGKGVAIEDVLAATAGVTASFEICDSRITGWKCLFPDIIADNGFAGRIVVSDQWHPVGQIDLPAETAVMKQAGEKIAEGSGALAMGHPAKAVCWLADKLAARGKGLKAGQVVMTGTLTPILPVEKNALYEASFSTMGDIQVHFK